MIFHDRFLQIFVPPWNNMSENLENILVSSGLNISKGNSEYSEYNDNNTDIDVINWNEKKMRNEEEILNDIISLITTGRKSIGIMGHHRVADRRAFMFFNRILGIIAKHQNNKHEGNNQWTAKVPLDH